MRKRAPKLVFTEEELQKPKLKKAADRADKAAKKLDKAKKKLPKAKKVTKERTVDPKTGQVTVRLRFEETEKKPPSKLVHGAKDTPMNVVSIVRHIPRTDEDDNSGTDAAQFAADSVEAGYRTVQHLHRSRQLKPYRTAARAEQRADRANVHAIRQTVREETPTTNPYSRWRQKKAIRQEYLKAKRAAQTTSNTVSASEIAAKAVTAAAEKVKQTAAFVQNHPKTLLVLGILSATLLLLFGVVSSCSTMVQGVLGSVGGSTFQSGEESMRDVEAAYCVIEDELRDELEHYEDLHPGFDEYRVSGEVLGHDPYVLTSILSAMFGEYTLSDVETALEQIFALQYDLTETETTELRYRTEEDGRRVPYDYKICTVTLTCTPLEDLAAELLTPEQFEMYEIYMETKGNYPDLFGTDPIRLDFMAAPVADTFQMMKAEAEKYLGFPYVWGGSTPETSFDC